MRNLTTDLAERAVSFVSIFSFISLFLVHFVLLWKYARNVPFMDDWNYLREGVLGSGSVRWVFSPNGEHLIIPTNIENWIMFQLTGWNLRTEQLVNFGIFGLVFGSVAWISKSLRTGLPRGTEFAFFLFLLNSLPIEIHLWAALSQYHFFLLFKFLGIGGLFHPRQRWWALLLGACSLALSVLSFSAGMAAAAPILLGFSAFKFYRFSLASPAFRQRELKQWLGAVFIIGMAIIYWNVAIGRNLAGARLNFFDQHLYWATFFSLVGQGFGLVSVSPWVGGALGLTIVSVSVFLFLAKRGRPRDSAADWIIIVCIASTLAEFAAVAMGRYFVFRHGVAWRYSEITTFLVPWSAAALALAFADRVRARALALLALWIFCLASFSGNWGLDKYRSDGALREVGRQCIHDYYSKGAPSVCSTLQAIPLRDMLEKARTLRVSFYQEWEASQAAPVQKGE